MTTKQSDHPASVVTLSAAQFDKIVELLTPGYELAKRYLEQSQVPQVVPLPDQGERTG